MESQLLTYYLQQGGIVLVMGVVCYFLYKTWQAERQAHIATQNAFMAFMKENGDKLLEHSKAELQSKLQMIGLLDQILKKIKV